MNDEPLDKRKTRLRKIDLQQGLQVGPFELDCRLGEGSTGVVWRGIDPYRAYKHNPGYVALKFLAQSAREDSVEITRAIDTFKVVHLLQHCHICPCYSLWEDQRLGHILAMRYVEGVSLHHYGQSLQGNGKAATDERLRVLRCVAAGLDYSKRSKEFAPAVTSLLEDLRVHKLESVKRVLQSVLSDSLAPRTHDDCSIALLQVDSRTRRVQRRAR